jgi:hypothetical protein
MARATLGGGRRHAGGVPRVRAAVPRRVQLCEALVRVVSESDRTLCYLASGRPVVVQHRGPSGFLPDGDGMFRFSTVEQAVDALHAIQASYEHHRRAAREIAETFFDARLVLSRMLDLVGHSQPAPVEQPAG